jgi:hypothetical protein
MSYGKTGKLYSIEGTEFNVDDKFVISTLMAIIYALKEMNKEYPSIDAAIENLAGEIYEQIKEVESSGVERTTDPSA